jgi:hypothetical protein
MEKNSEHLERVHSDQPLQCPRCTRSNFWTPQDLLAHQTALEACMLVPLTQVKRMKWISDNHRLALQTEIAKELRGRSGEEKWKFAYARLFPDVSMSEIPSPCKYLGLRLCIQFPDRSSLPGPCHLDHILCGRSLRNVPSRCATSVQRRPQS